MHNNTEYKTAKAFIKRHKIKILSVSVLEDALKKSGYNTVYFNSTSNTKETEKLLKNHEIKAFAKTKSSFTFEDHSTRTVFIKDELSEQEKIILLCREIGYIQAKDFQKQPEKRQSILFEHFANEFAHYLIHMTSNSLVSRILKSPLKYSVSLFSSSLLIFAVCIMFSFSLGSVYNSTSDFFDIKETTENLYNLNENINTPETDTDTDIVLTGSFESATENLDSLFDNNDFENETHKIDDNVIQEPVQNKTLQDNQVSVQETTNSQVTTQPPMIQDTSAPTQTSTVPEEILDNAPVSQENQSLQDLYFVTKSGKKYHESFCSYVAGKDNLIEISKENIKDTKYEPCSRCIK